MALTMRVIAVYMTIDRSFIVQFPSNGSSSKKRTDRRKKTAPKSLDENHKQVTLPRKISSVGQNIENIEQLAQ
jgi:hypothetical protein